MDARGRAFRNSRIELLEFFGSVDQQLAWQTRTPSLDSGEVLCWWAEDYCPDTDWFRSAFSEAEIALLRSFNDHLERVFAKFGTHLPQMSVLVNDKDWITVVGDAAQLAGALRSAA